MKRFTSLVLTFVLLISMFATMAVPALAAETGAEMDPSMQEAMAIAQKLEQIKAFVAKVEGKVKAIVEKIKARTSSA